MFEKSISNVKSGAGSILYYIQNAKEDVLVVKKCTVHRLSMNLCMRVSVSCQGLRKWVTLSTILRKQKIIMK